MPSLRGPNPNTDVASRNVADQGLGSKGMDVHAEARKRLANAAYDLGRPAVGIYLIGSIVASSWISRVLASS